MRITIKEAALVAAFLFCFAACGDSSFSGVSSSDCVPNQSQACTCTDGSAGAQACNGLGDGFLECECEGAGNNDPGNNDPGNNDPGNNDPGNNDPGNNDPGDNCPDELFLDVANEAGPGGNFPDPTLSVTCTDTTMVVQSNGIPHYQFNSVTPAGLQEQDFRFEIPLEPQVAGETSEIPLLGTAGFAVNGLPIYGPNEGPMPDPFGDPIINDILDFCMGHTGFNADYHYHALLVECFFPATEDDAPSPILGFSLDGFPIYGPKGCLDEECNEVVTFDSSWEQTGDPRTYAWDNHACTRPECQESQGTFLDQCNGRIGPDGTYRYHATATFPYILGCYRGTANGAGDNAPGGNNMNPGDNNNVPPDMGPMSCTEEADCEGACPDGSLGCTCNQSPMGLVCVPTCNTDADCPAVGQMNLVCNEADGICVPER